MSLEYDPDFVSSKVDLLEVDIADLEDNFMTKSQLAIDVNTQLSVRTSQLR